MSRCPAGHTTLETGAESVGACVRGEVDECLLQTHDCPDTSFCMDTSDSFSCVCQVGYTKLQDGSCRGRYMTGLVKNVSPVYIEYIMMK